MHLSLGILQQTHVSWQMPSASRCAQSIHPAMFWWVPKLRVAHKGADPRKAEAESQYVIFLNKADFQRELVL